MHETDNFFYIRDSRNGYFERNLDIENLARLLRLTGVVREIKVILKVAIPVNSFSNLKFFTVLLVSVRLMKKKKNVPRSEGAPWKSYA